MKGVALLFIINVAALLLLPVLYLFDASSVRSTCSSRHGTPVSYSTAQSDFLANDGLKQRNTESKLIDILFRIMT